jgi:SAM-dependent methyltransferase
MPIDRQGYSVEMDEHISVDGRLSAEFHERLGAYMGPADPASSLADRERAWYRDHAGGRSAWFRENLVPRLERVRPLAGQRVLDFGCGTGSSAVVMAERGAHVIGVDTDRVSLRVATQRAADLDVGGQCTFVRIPFIDQRGMSLPLADGSVDVCVLVGVLEHMEAAERPACAEAIRRVLRPGGALFIFDTPNRAHPFDHHTTRLWFLGWMPQRAARWYAIARRRFDRDKDFIRYGGNGVSRTQIDRIFPSSRWAVAYEKSTDEIAREFGWLGERVTIVPPTLRAQAGSALVGAARAFFRILEQWGGRPAFWTASHTLCLRRR